VVVLVIFLSKEARRSNATDAGRELGDVAVCSPDVVEDRLIINIRSASH
jgi:hypothetical protein